MMGINHSSFSYRNVFLRKFLLVLFCAICTGPSVSAQTASGGAQDIFDDFGRSLYRQFLQDALRELNSHQDIIALNSVRDAFDNMEHEVRRHGESIARRTGVAPGYEPRLNVFAGSLPGYTVRFDADRSDREGRESGFALTIVNYARDGSGRGLRELNDVVMLILGYGLSAELAREIGSGMRQASDGQYAINGVSYFRQNPTGARVERSYASIIDNRLVIFAVGGDLTLVESVLSVLDIDGLIAFRQ